MAQLTSDPSLCTRTATPACCVMVMGLVVAPPTCKNCFEVLVGAQIQNALLPGLPFTLGALGSTALATLDAPILDDNLLGSPGMPGITAPNL